MNWQKLPCRWCGMTFELARDRLEHERCHTDPMPSSEQRIAAEREKARDDPS